MALLGLYFVVGHGVDFSAQSLRGDLLMLGGVMCWATYSVASQPILKRHSPLVVIAITFSVGATMLVDDEPILLDVMVGGVGIQLVPDVFVRVPGAERVLLDLVYRPQKPGGSRI